MSIQSVPLNYTQSMVGIIADGNGNGIVDDKKKREIVDDTHTKMLLTTVNIVAYFEYYKYIGQCTKHHTNSIFGQNVKAMSFKLFDHQNNRSEMTWSTCQQMYSMKSSAQCHQERVVHTRTKASCQPYSPWPNAPRCSRS